MRRLLSGHRKHNTLKILSSHLVNLIDANSGLSLTYLFDPGVSNLYYYLNYKDYTADEYSYVSLAQSYTTTLNNRMTLLGDSITGVGFIPHQENQDKLFYLKKYDSLKVLEDYNYSDSYWYQQLQHNNQTALFVPSATSEVPNTISLIRTVKNIDKRQTIGYILLDISMDFIFESLSDITISPYSGIFLVSPKGEFLFGTDEALRPPLRSLLHQDVSSPGNNKRYDLYSFTDKGYGFTFYYLSSRHDLYASLRFEERLDFQIFLEPGLENFEIPKLLVQPLVENAIVHGLEPSDQNEFIRLSALAVTSRNGEAFTVITVINSGLPFIENKSYKRVGLRNIEDRLTIFSLTLSLSYGAALISPRNVRYCSLRKRRCL